MKPKLLVIVIIFCLAVPSIGQSLTMQEILQGHDNPQGQVLGASTIAQIEAVSGVSNGSGTITVSLGTPTTQGELVVVDVYTGENGNTPTSVTDNKSDSYTQLWSIANVGTHLDFGLYYLANAQAGITSLIITENGDNFGGAVVSPLHRYSRFQSRGCLFSPKYHRLCFPLGQFRSHYHSGK